MLERRFPVATDALGFDSSFPGMSENTVAELAGALRLVMRRDPSGEFDYAEMLGLA